MEGGGEEREVGSGVEDERRTGGGGGAGSRRLGREGGALSTRVLKTSFLQNCGFR